MNVAKRVLIVDDENNYRNELKELLLKSFDKIDTSGPEDYKNKINNNIYELIILDFILNGINGYDVYKEIRKFDKRSQILFLTHIAKEDFKLKEIVMNKIPLYNKTEEDLIEKILYNKDKIKFLYEDDMSVLIVEDEDKNFKDYSEILKYLHIDKIKRATSIFDAEIMIKNYYFNVFLIDMCYKENGIEICKGHLLVDKIVNIFNDKQYLLLPITTKEIGKIKLNNYTNRKFVFPAIKEEIDDFHLFFENKIFRSDFGVIYE
ncbi:MAG TPA: response regulator [bacterium]|nr:response regulator [bacterium]HPN43946.1 response regulator [bacterium]